MEHSNQLNKTLIQSCVESGAYAALLNGNDNHDNGLKLVMDILPYTRDEELIKSIISSALGPDYKGNTLNEVPQLIQWCADNATNDFLDTSSNRKSMAVQCIEVINGLNIELFHDSYLTPYITFREADCGPKTYLLNGRTARTKLRGIIYRVMDKSITAQTFAEVIDILSARALFDNEEKEVFLRTARHKESVIINLADDQGRVVIIDKDGFTVSKESPVPFVCSPNMEALPVPTEAGYEVFDELKNLFGLEDQNFTRVLAFMVSTLKPEEPYLLLIVQGEQGSGKSELSRGIKMTCDPSKAPKSRLPDNPADLSILAKDMQILVFDNLSGMSGKMSDALCALLTGSANAKRRLYTNDELHISYEAAPVIINGIAGIANRPDLLDRSISINLPPMPSGQRKTEAELRSNLDKLRPRLLGALFGLTSEALKNFDKTETPTSVRMADIGKWLIAAEPATDLAAGSFLAAIEDSQNEIIEESMFGNSIVIALINYLPAEGYDGKLGRLFHDLKAMQERYDPTFPKTAAHLSKALKRLRPAMKKIGIHCEFGTRDNKGQNIKIWLENREWPERDPARLNIPVDI
ncbi:MAG: hypothetical protein VXY16_03255 [Pseudomonadota bacterium]|nr:hypothetical protein [Pseudomonadota bacterium]